MAYKRLDQFKFWCQKVLPLVYDDSLSYYEVLCKVVDYINNLINDNNSIIDELENLKADMKIVQKWIDEFDTKFIEKAVQEYIASSIKGVVFGLSTEGYFMALIPSTWNEIKFGTIQEGDLYGHLVLNYD